MCYFLSVKSKPRKKKREKIHKLFSLRKQKVPRKVLLSFKSPSFPSLKNCKNKLVANFFLLSQNWVSVVSKFLYLHSTIKIAATFNGVFPNWKLRIKKYFYSYFKMWLTACRQYILLISSPFWKVRLE